MGLEQLFSWDGYIRYMEKCLALWGQAATVFVPSTLKLAGYGDSVIDNYPNKPVVEGVANSYDQQNVKVIIDFHINKSVFYKFNWFPDNQDELMIAYMTIADRVPAPSHLRTRTTESTSIWGDMIYEIVRTEDVGKYRTLKRLYFLRPVASTELNDILRPEPEPCPDYPVPEEDMDAE